jgi:hypothetical protein
MFKSMAKPSLVELDFHPASYLKQVASSRQGLSFSNGARAPSEGFVTSLGARALILFPCRFFLTFVLAGL